MKEFFPTSCLTCAALVTCPFTRLPGKVMRELSTITRIRRYARRALVFRQGEHASSLFVIRSGWVKLSYVAATGKMTSVGLIGPGGIMGITELLIQTPYQVSAETIHESELDCIVGEQFVDFLQDNPIVAVELLRLICCEIHKSRATLGDVASKLPSMERLLHTLQDLSETCGEATGHGIRLRLSLTVQDIADTIACSRQWTSKLLTDLETRGSIVRDRGRITLTPQALGSHLFGR